MNQGIRCRPRQLHNVERVLMSGRGNTARRCRCRQERGRGRLLSDRPPCMRYARMLCTRICLRFTRGRSIALSARGEAWSAFVYFCAIRTGGPPTPIAHNIPIASSPSSPHPLATASSSNALLSKGGFATCVVWPPICSGADCSDGGGFEGPGPGAYQATSIWPTVGKLVPLAYPYRGPSQLAGIKLRGIHPTYLFRRTPRFE